MAVAGSGRALWRWIERSGGMISQSIEIVKNASSSHGVGGYSLRAVRHIKPFEILMQIPFDCCLREAIPSAADDCPDPEGFAELKLMNSLLKERSNISQSRVAPYLQSLPDDFLTFPQSWNAKMWTELEKTTFKTLYDQKKKRYDILREVMGRQTSSPAEEVDPQEWKWAECMVTSRSIPLEKVLALIPLVDLCGHDDEMMVEPLGVRGCVVLSREWNPAYPDSINGYSLVALAEHNPGMEILRCYGDITFEDKICEFGWLDYSRRLAAYTTMKLALPLIPQYQFYRKMKYQDNLCVFRGQQQYLYVSICEFLQQKKITRGTFVRALKRRLKELMESKEFLKENMNKAQERLDSSLASTSQEKSTETAIVLHSSQSPTPKLMVWPDGEEPREHLKTKETILAMEIQKIEIILVLVEKEERYNHFLRKLHDLQKERDEREVEESKVAEQMAMMLEQETGLDLTQIMEGGEEEGEGDEEEFERIWKEGGGGV